jgi:hypothetical protein
MYGRMKHKGISILAICALAVIPARALEDSLRLLPGSPSQSMSASTTTAPEGARAIGDWVAEGATLRKGYKGGMDYVLADNEYKSEAQADLLLHFDSPASDDETGNWALSAGPAFSIDRSKSMLGGGSASFKGPDSMISLSPRSSSIFGGSRGGASSFRDFSIEFWLYPANADNGEVVLLWRSLRKLPSGLLSQQLSCVVSGGRLAWSFAGFFSPPTGAKGAGAAKGSEHDSTRLELRGRAPLVPRVWSHHLLRFDGDTGLVEYLVDGRPEATAYATASGREGGTVFEPAVGSPAPIQLGPDYSGLVDEFRLSRSFVEEPMLRPFGQDASTVYSPVADLRYGNSLLTAIEAECKTPGSTGIEFAYRVSDSWAGWKDDSPAWIPFRIGERLPDSARGRYAQVRAQLYADGSGRLSPSLSSITLRFVADPPPPAPARLVATPKDGAVELHWTRIPEADLAGYLVYYGERPGEYFGTGADQGPSPVDAGNTTTLTLTGIPNGKLLYFVVAAYDSGPDPDAGIPGARVLSTGAARSRAESRAGEFSPETSARPSRTAR